MGIKEYLVKAEVKTADKLAKLAALSPEQVKKVEEEREKYLYQKPDPTDTAAEELTNRLLAAAGVEIYNAHLAQLKELYIPVERSAEYGGAFDVSRNIRFMNITKWVVDKDENSLEKLVNVYEVLSNEDCNISLVFHRTCDTTNVYLAVTNTHNADNNVDVENYRIRLEDAIRGNFPGAEWASGKHSGKLPCLDNEIDYSVAAASNIPAEKSEKFTSQTIEKLLDGIVPEDKSKEYIIILLATPVRDIEQRKIRLAEMYSALAPYASWQTSFTYDEHSATGSSATVGINIGASAGVQNGQNQAFTEGQGVTDSESDTDSHSDSTSVTQSSVESETTSKGSTVTSSSSKSESDMWGETVSSGKSRTDGSSSSHTNTKGRSNSVGALGGIGAKIFHVGANYSHGQSTGSSESYGNSVSDTLSEGLSKSISAGISQSTGQSVAESGVNAIGKAVGSAVAATTGRTIAKTLGRAVSHTASKTVGAFKATNFGVNFGANFARSSNVTATIGKSEGIHQNFVNYTIKHALENLEAQMKRLELSTALGMWDFAAYFLSEDQNVANNVAHSYVALTQGEESFVSHSAINLWRGNMGEESRDASEICGYLRELRHPVFALNPTLVESNSDYMVYPPLVTAVTGLSGKELAYSLNFPRKSITGLPVIECAEFGRNIASYDLWPEDKGGFELGHIFHMHHQEKPAVSLTKNSLTAHTFITGSTGSGKSNTIYRILNNALKQNVKFMVVEPAKGEYKHVFGGREDVTVLGTNPSVSKLLRLNPFSFNRNTHILEHLDRLIEIFNVCWPMYAAMPAVLKNAAEKAYEDCGWNLIKSENKFGEDIFPTFSDVAVNIKKIIESSEYDAENKGAYKGSLLTRLQSLTNGINGLIFGSQEISEEELFDRNVIVDLSRVGSSETKSLIMGILVLKLQEYRMYGSTEINSELKHITVLEEAHNLLKRTPTEQYSDGAGLQGKSVEMLANAIAEMRTCGEGFVIADQAPGLLDLSVIRNTNTKIIMRLPDLEDRKLVGYAAGLNEQQISEISKLPCGVAAVYQNEWIQPVLCKVQKYEGVIYPYQARPDSFLAGTEKKKELLLHNLICKSTGTRMNMNLKELTSILVGMDLPAERKISLLKALRKNGKCNISDISQAVYELCCDRKTQAEAEKEETIEEWKNTIVYAENSGLSYLERTEQNIAVECILREQIKRHIKPAEYLEIWNSFLRGDVM